MAVIDRSYENARGAVDRHGKPLKTDERGWPPGTEKWTDSSFGAKQHSDFEHPTQHNLSPVAGDDSDAAKSKWHYDRAGIVTKAGAMAKKRMGSFAKAAVYDFRSRMKDIMK